MKQKISSKELIKKYSCSPPPALREYLLMHSAPFFEAFIDLAEEYLGGCASFWYEHYTNIINNAYEEEERKKKPYIADLLIKGHKDQSGKLCTAILHAVFLYPMKIIRAYKMSQTESVELPEFPENPDFWWLSQSESVELPEFPKEPDNWGLTQIKKEGPIIITMQEFRITNAYKEEDIINILEEHGIKAATWGKGAFVVRAYDIEEVCEILESYNYDVLAYGEKA